MRFLITFAAALGLLLAAPARAADHESAKGAAHEALEAQAKAPKTPPTLPDEALLRAQSVDHGKKGAAERAAHSESGEVDSEAARHVGSDTESDAANKSAQGAAASAAKGANADSHDAAGQARDTSKRGGNTPGSGPGGHGHDPNPNPGHGH